MSEVTIVAIPEAEDPIWKQSSEKVPHMTLLFLGEVGDGLQHIVEYVSHAVETTLNPFYMSTTERGTLGPDKADVLFFDKERSARRGSIESFRSFLLADPVIKTAYDSADQYPNWTPHLTLGYPATPAKKTDDKSVPNYGGVFFSHIAVWVGDYEGPTFKMPRREYNENEDLAMADTTAFLAHYGVKGMQWGKRKATGPTPVTVSQTPGKKVQTSGGTGKKASGDAIIAAKRKQIAKKSTTDALTNKELKELVARMNLEQQYSDLSAKQMSPGKKYVNDLLIGLVKQNVNQAANQQAQSFMKARLNKMAAG